MPRNQLLVPQARAALERMKYEIANEIGVPNYHGYLGDVPARIHGHVGGNIVRRLVQMAEQQISGSVGAAVAPATPPVTTTIGTPNLGPS